MDRQLATVLTIFLAFAAGMTIGLLAGLNMGKEQGFTKGKCSAYEALIIATGARPEPMMFPLDCPQRQGKMAK